MSVIYNLLVGPLQLIFEVVFAFANRFFANPGYSIIFLSLAMNFLVLPLYKRADAMQAEQRDTEQRLKPWVDHIKKTFKGDERFMMLQTFYRQNNYKPTDALKGSVSLLLEIPFFIAAYKMLSSLQLLQGVEFGPIKDLGAPDQMFMIGAFAVNVLPILMTVINVVSGVIYTKGMSTQSKVQLFGMAAIFLVLLYNSPAGLVFYWTLNNVFSLVKNIFYKLKNPKKVLGILSSVCGIGVLIFGVFVHPMDTTKKQLAIILFAVALQLPIILYFFNKNAKSAKEVVITKKDNITFFLGGLYVALLTGLLIPSTLVSDSPEEFINAVTLGNPSMYVVNSLMFALGTFVIWFGIFYMLATAKGKKTMSLFMWILAGVGTVDYMFFGTNYGNINSKLRFDVAPGATMQEQLINILVIVGVAALFVVIWKYKSEISRLVYVTVCLAVVGMSIHNISNINKVAVPAIEKKQAEKIDNERPSFNFSKDGKNVVVIMMDRAMNCYIPYLFNEKPDVAKQFDGFTYYPNTISHGSCTNIGSPGLYGGYEYIPEEMNKRDQELLVDKQNEALKVMPVIYDSHGYDVTVCDPSYAGYAMEPDLSIYDDYPDIRTFNTMGSFDDYNEKEILDNERKLNRNFFFYSLFKIAPVVVQPTIYSTGVYNNPDDVYVTQHGGLTGSVNMVHVPTSLSTATGISERFMRAYNVLDNMPLITNVNEGDQNTFLMMSNDTSHEPMLLQTPNYVPSEVVDNTEYDAAHQDRFEINGIKLHTDDVEQMAHYHVNMAMVIKLGQWFDYLRANGVYDNTKIIIVADHGYHMEQYDPLPRVEEFGEYGERLLNYNPLLMVKDFNATGFTTDNQFMTNADVPTLATKDTIDNPVNPFTGKPITNDAKQGEQHISFSHVYKPWENCGTTFVEKPWGAVHDDIFNLDNWSVYTPEN